MTAERTICLRLIDILTTENTPLVKIATEEQQYLYDNVIDNYINSYIETDNEEQFIKLFNHYWNRNIKKYEALLKRESEILENLNTDKNNNIDIVKSETETPNITQNESWTYGKQNTINYGKQLDITPNITEEENITGTDTQTNTGSTINAGNSTVTKYNQSIEKTDSENTLTNNLTNELTHGTTTNKTRTGSENHTNSGSDVSIDSGTNSHDYTQTGNRTINGTNNTTNIVKRYDVEKFKMITNINKIVDLFVDECYNLFMKVMFIL